jgi:hypothetical protein
MDKISDGVRLRNNVHCLKHIINERVRLVVGPIRENIIVTTDPCLDFGERFFDGIEVRGIRRQIDKPYTWRT